MTRPKVPPELRQRTAQACDSCKRRKQKCNGLCPCNTCDKRKFTCIYSDRDGQSPSDPRPTKKRALDDGDLSFQNEYEQSLGTTPSDEHVDQSPDAKATQVAPVSHLPTTNGSLHDAHRHGFSQFNIEDAGLQSSDERPTVEAASQSRQAFVNGNTLEEPPTLMSRGTTVQSGQDEEAVVYTQTRMLQDPTGRLLYVGDAATLSFLQLLRMMVESVSGSSPFTNDPRRHKIVEGQFSLPFGSRHTPLLPDQNTARILVDAFFVNTHGLLQVFERQAFMEDLDRCYSDPLATESSWLCLLNIVFAIGLTMATPMSGSPEAVVIERLRSEHLDRAEVFYLNAKSLNDPMTGFEDQDFWSVQALLLMAVYMLAKSKRNTAFVLLGMAIRSALALGLHREETMVIFGPNEQAARRNLWRSLFVFDRLLSCILGRPTAISEDECSGDTLRPADPPDEPPLHTQAKQSFSQTGESALEAAVRSCSVIGTILKKVYQQRKISTRLAQEIADICKEWPRALPGILHWRQATSASPSQGVAILHVNLFYCHSIILLTRPFFLYILNMETQRQAQQAANTSRGPRPYLRMEKFSEACVIASTHTILLVHNAFDAGYLSRRNPAVIYFLFSAALVILANGFAGLYRVDAADTCIANAITIMSYCSESDQQASRLIYILSSFRDVVASQRMRRKQSLSHTEILNLPSIASQLYGVSGTNQQRSTSFSHSDQFDNPTSSNRLHQVPIHIYPGMHTTPLPTEASTTVPQSYQMQPPTHQTPQSQPTSVSVQLSPTQVPLSMEPKPDTITLNPISKSTSLSQVLDLSDLDATRVPSIYSEGSNGPEEEFDFNQLWSWPANTPAVGTPRAEGGVGFTGMDKMQGVSDSAVPLFGVVGGDNVDA